MQVPTATGNFDKVVLGEKGGYMLKQGKTYMTGNSFTLEG